MRFKHVIFLFSVSLAIVTSGTYAVFAHKGATGIVKERMDAMAGMGKIVKAMAEMMRGDKDYNEGQVKDGAGKIKTHAGDAITKLFPEKGENKHSEALPTVWKNWDEFKALAEELKVLAAGLEAASKNGRKMDDLDAMDKPDMMGGSGMMGGAAKKPAPEELAKMHADTVFNLMTKTCSGCHTKFRKEKDKNKKK